MFDLILNDLTAVVFYIYTYIFLSLFSGIEKLVLSNPGFVDNVFTFAEAQHCERYTGHCTDREAIRSWVSQVSLA